MSLYLPDTPEGRAVEACAASMAMVRKLARIAMLALVQLVGPDATAQYMVGLSRDALEMRGFGRGRTGRR